MKAIIVISGFTEEDHKKTGSWYLWAMLRNGYSSSNCVVLLKEWNEEWKDFAHQLEFMGVKDCLVCAYSWGAGYGLKEFAKYFSGEINSILCDPVYHSKWFSGRWRAILNKTRKLFGGVIKYTDNVSVKQWFNQKQNVPRGDPIEAVDMPLRPVTLPYKHSEIDNSIAYHHAAITEADKYIKK